MGSPNSKHPTNDDSVAHVLVAGLPVVLIGIFFGLMVPACGYKAQKDGGLACCYCCCTSLNISTNCFGILLIMLPLAGLVTGANELGNMCSPAHTC